VVFAAEALYHFIAKIFIKELNTKASTYIRIVVYYDFMDTQIPSLWNRKSLHNQKKWPEYSGGVRKKTAYDKSTDQITDWFISREYSSRNSFCFFRILSFHFRMSL